MASLPEEVEEFLEEISALLDNDKYKFAWETLAGIKANVLLSRRVTPRQIQAMKNIRGDSAHEPKEWKRRYEGHGR